VTYPNQNGSVPAEVEAAVNAAEQANSTLIALKLTHQNLFLKPQAAQNRFSMPQAGKT